jgi:hypothetical protein
LEERGGKISAFEFNNGEVKPPPREFARFVDVPKEIRLALSRYCAGRIKAVYCRLKAKLDLHSSRTLNHHQFDG